MKLYENGIFLVNGTEIIEDNGDAAAKLAQKGILCEVIKLNRISPLDSALAVLLRVFLSAGRNAWPVSRLLLYRKRRKK